MHIEVISRRPASGFSDKVPILCVPGGFQGAWCWDEYFLPYFAEAGFEEHALSLRGHGASDGHQNINQWRLDDYVEDLATVISKMPAQPVLIGHSVGGAVVQKYIEKHSAPAAILLASSPVTHVMSTTLRMAMKHPASYIRLLFTHNMQHALKMLEASFFSSDMPDEKARGYLNRMEKESYRAFLDIILLNKPKPPKPGIPMLVMGGERDTSIPIQANRDLAKACNTSLETFPIAHEMMLDINWEPVARRVVSWLSTKFPYADKS